MISKQKKIIGFNAFILEACKEGDIRRVEDMIKKGVDLDSKLPNGNTCLMIALLNGHENIAELLVRNGANVDIKNDDGVSPIFLCIEQKNWRIPDESGYSLKIDDLLKLLIQKTNDINFQEKKTGRTVLSELLTHVRDNDEMVNLILDKNPDLNLQDNLGETALMHAITNDYKIYQTIRKLLERGADVNQSDTSGKTTLMHAILNNNPGKEYEDIVIEIIHKSSNVDIQDNDGFTALRYSSHSFGTEDCSNQINKLLISKTRNINLQEKVWGRTVLMQILWRTEGDNDETVNLILDKNPDLNLQDNKGITALMHAIMNEYNIYNTISKLVKLGADLTLKDKNGKTAMNLAVDTGNIDIIRAIDPHFDILTLHIQKLERLFTRGYIDFTSLFEFYKDFCKNDTCTWGQNVIGMLEFKGHKISELNKNGESIIKAILNPLTGDLLCIDMSEEQIYWNTIEIIPTENNKTYNGIIIKDITKSQFEREYTITEKHRQFANFGASQHVFFLKENIPIIINSKSKLFIQILTPFRWYDIQQNYAGSYHNRYRDGDPVYIIVPC